MNRLEVLATGPLTTVQDRGRPGFAAIGVPRAGALDRGAAAQALRLVGAAPSAAVLESLLGGLEVRVRDACWAAVTGAVAAVEVEGRPVPWGRAVRVPAGARLRVGTASHGLRTYLAIGGGVALPPVLGSRATDTLAWVGPPAIAVGDVLPLDAAAGPPGIGDALPPVTAPILRLHPGPHAGRFADGVLDGLLGAAYRVASDSDRIGLRLHGPAIARTAAELPSEGMVLGAVQVPPDGQPVVFLADHPTTGGYPVVGVVDPRDVDRCAQVRPGDVVRFARA
ncbi:biotin-dependent carboxyltransferase family protein [Nocardioides fonticola]|uniref:Biotin-dependent carboxyltransferase family protein n=1 Tax=Nocardioides fonticola TaxID=450363 RepID=A0ABP7Y2L4_9ACTN